MYFFIGGILGLIAFFCVIALGIKDRVIYTDPPIVYAAAIVGMFLTSLGWPIVVPVAALTFVTRFYVEKHRNK